MDYDFRGTERFEVVARLGEGAMGVVYRAVDRERNETVALKALRHLDGDRLLRFKNEFRTIQTLQHPNLVSLGELVETRGRWFFTMELVDGIDFYNHVRLRLDRAGSAEGADRDRSGIDGTGIDLEPGRPPPSFDEERLRSALLQLSLGVAALHRAGFVHRDIKPSNIVVSRTGRVVLLDFGFVTGVNDRSSDRVVGTIAYMSPEQAASVPVGPESDWYSVGVVLYEVLTGRPPFDGMPLEVLMAKQFRTPVRPGELIEGLPPDLEELCMDLLRTSPADRPGEAEIMRRLGAEPDPGAAIRSSINMPHNLFIGRQEELRELRHAFARCRRGETVAVIIQGESGIGKTSLVRAFTDELERRHRDALVLHSACHERESVPFKAFDGVADSLSDYLVDLPQPDAAMLVPLHVAHVADVFPVLRRCEVIGRALRPAATGMEPAEVRARVFAGLREMFARLSIRRPVVIVIDDFQWADADSLALLRELARPPDAPPLLVVTTVRDGGETPIPIGAPAQAIGAASAVHLRLAGLPADEAREMVERLTEMIAPGMEGGVASIVAESRGHPLYIDEIVRFGALEGIEHGAALHLQDVLWSRVLMLDPPSREIVELVAVASAPLEKGLVAATLRQRFADFVRRVGHLRLVKLVQTTGVRKADRIELFHDQVRRAVLANLGGEQRRAYHERLALALEGTPNAAPEALAIHWGGAGETERAFDYTRIAADQAARALAFDRAARLYRRCLDLLPAGSREGVALRTQLGDALVQAGRGAEAANAYLSAAQEARTGAVELNARAAGQLLRSGHVDSSIEVLRRALEGLELRLPETPRAALFSLMRQRVLIRLHRLTFRPAPGERDRRARAGPHRHLVGAGGRLRAHRRDPRGRVSGQAPAPGPGRRGDRPRRARAVDRDRLSQCLGHPWPRRGSRARAGHGAHRAARAATQPCRADHAHDRDRRHLSRAVAAGRGALPARRGDPARPVQRRCLGAGQRAHHGSVGALVPGSRTRNVEPAARHPARGPGARRPLRLHHLPHLLHADGAAGAGRAGACARGGRGGAAALVAARLPLPALLPAVRRHAGAALRRRRRGRAPSGGRAVAGAPVVAPAQRAAEPGRGAPLPRPGRASVGERVRRPQARRPSGVTGAGHRAPAHRVGRRARTSIARRGAPRGGGGRSRGRVPVGGHRRARRGGDADVRGGGAARPWRGGA